MGCHALLKGIFLTQGSNPCLLHLLHRRWIIYYWTTGEVHQNQYLVPEFYFLRNRKPFETPKVNLIFLSFALLLAFCWHFSLTLYHVSHFQDTCKYTWVSSIKMISPFSSVRFRSVAQSCPTPFDPMNRSTSGLPVHHQLPEFTQTHIHRVGDAIQPSHPLSSPSPPAPNPSQHHSLFQWVNSSHAVAKVLEFQL